MIILKVSLPRTSTFPTVPCHWLDGMWRKGGSDDFRSCHLQPPCLVSARQPRVYEGKFMGACDMLNHNIYKT